MSSDLERILNVAIVAARSAGRVIVEYSGKADVDHEKASAQDLVTACDVEAQRLIESAIQSAFPSHGILGEESVAAGGAASAAAIAAHANTEWLWVVDPIDGTTNFVHGERLGEAKVAT